MKRKEIAPLIEALETDNTTALRQLAREQGLEIEELLFRVFEAAAVVYSTKREPSRSQFFEAVLTIGKELDSAAIAWAILDRKRREEAAEASKARGW